jgi:hypothetical protein
VLQNLFGNSITLMAAALGVPHASLSRVINHGQLPSAEMILGLARIGRVNLDWLLGGDDAPPTSTCSAGTFLPVSDRLLPGPPSGSPELLPPLGLPTASPFQLHDAYWHHVLAGSPIATWDDGKKEDRGSKDDGLEVRAGDLLLIEAGPAWTARASAFAGRLVVLRHPEQPAGLFARVAEDEEFFSEVSSRHHKLNTFGIYPEADLFVESTRPPDELREPVESGPDGSPAFYLSDVVGVVLEKRVLIGAGRR